MGRLDVLSSSVVGLTSDRGIRACATSKHALVGLMRTAAKEVADRGTRVNTIHPGPVSNGFQRRIETVAETVLFLASDESRFMTGATVSLDGGMSI